MKPTDLLLDEHRRIASLLEQCLRGSGDERAQLARTAASELRRHWRLEEEVFYPVLSRLRDDRARVAVREALEQHHAMDGLLAEIETVEPDDALFETRLRALQDAFSAHARHEETAIFAQALDTLSPARLEKLAGQVRARRR